MSPRLPLLLLATLACGSEDRLVRPADQLQRATGPSYNCGQGFLPRSAGTQSRGMAINGSCCIVCLSNLSGGTRLCRPLAQRRHHRPPHARRSEQHRPRAGAERRRNGGRDLRDRRDRLGWTRTGAASRAGSSPVRTRAPSVRRGSVWQNDATREPLLLGGTRQLRSSASTAQARSWAGGRLRCTTAPASTIRCSASAPRSGSRSPETRNGSRLPSCRPGTATRCTLAATAITTRGRRSASPAAGTRAWTRFSAPSGAIRSRNCNWKACDSADAGRPHLAHADGHQRARGDAGGFGSRRWRAPRATSSCWALPRTDGSATAKDLRTLPGNLFSEAFAINERDQVVGISFCGTAATHVLPRAENHVLVSTPLIWWTSPPTRSSRPRTSTTRGRITGWALDGTNGQVLVFVATPTACALGRRRGYGFDDAGCRGWEPSGVVPRPRGSSECSSSQSPRRRIRSSARSVPRGRPIPSGGGSSTRPRPRSGAGSGPASAAGRSRAGAGAAPCGSPALPRGRAPHRGGRAELLERRCVCAGAGGGRKRQLRRAMERGSWASRLGRAGPDREADLVSSLLT